MAGAGAGEPLGEGVTDPDVSRSQDYRATKAKPDHAPVFDHLVESAAEVLTLPNETANRGAYEAANAELLKRADRLVVVWDGAPPSGKGGGTADTVEAARAAGLPVGQPVTASAHVRDVNLLKSYSSGHGSQDMGTTIPRAACPDLKNWVHDAEN